MFRVLTWPFRWFWRNRKLFAIVIGSLLLVAGVTLLIVNPRGVVWGYLFGEKFYDGQPVSQWRKEFAAGWEEELLGLHTLFPFTHPYPKDQDGSPILCDLLTDPDVNVRRMAASGLRSVGVENPVTIPPLATALADPDPWVRGLAAEAIGRRGEAAREHFPTLLKLMADSDPKVSQRAEAGAWGLDGDRMAEKAGWVTHRSDRGRYTARFPVRPTVKESVAENDGWRIKYERAEGKTADWVFAVEYTDESLAEPKPDGEGIRWGLTVPLVQEYVAAAGLSGMGEMRKGEEGSTGLAMRFSGTDTDGHPVVYLSLDRSAADQTTEGAWMVMAIDRTSKKQPPPLAIMKMSYFLRAFKPDPRAKAD